MRRPRARCTRQQTAPSAPIRSASRWMVGRRTVKPVGGRVVGQRMCRPDCRAHQHGGGQRRSRLRGLQGAHRYERTVLAGFILLLVGTTWHVSRHCRHAGHFGSRRRFGNGWRHQGCHHEASGHEDRKSEIEKPAKVHCLSFHGGVAVESPPPSQICNSGVRFVFLNGLGLFAAHAT